MPVRASENRTRKNVQRHDAASFYSHSELAEMLRRIAALEAAVGNIRHDHPPPVESEPPPSPSHASPMERDRIVLDVPEAGRLLGLSRNAAYEAAKRGQIPTIRIGSRILVPRAALARLLETTAPRIG
jgi:excisionase family DNA binding protein